jgi:hypothetical protein
MLYLESFVLFNNATELAKGERAYLGELKGKNEAWLRDTLFDHPEILPTDDLDATYGPLVPLCKELRTEAGPIDAVFINERELLLETFVRRCIWSVDEASLEAL